jgi:hypothetical protein
MNANKFIQLLKDNSGVSYNMVTKEYNPNKGYFVSVPNLETKVSLQSLSVDDIATFINRHRTLLQDETKFVGGWIDNEIVYLDISEQISDKREALERGYKHNQLAIYNASEGKVIDLPTPQRTGTTTQQKAYITQVIERLISAKNN